MTREQQLLIDRRIDGSLPPADFDALEDLLSRDDEAISHYCDQIAVHGCLEWHFNAARGQLRAAKRKTKLVEETRLRQQKRIVSASLAIAALVLLSLGVTLFFIHSGRQPTLALRFNPAASYQIIRKNGETPNDSKPLKKGDRLILKSGSVELTLETGVRAVLESPADLSFVGGKHVRLEEGQAYFEVTTDEAKGFTVDLPKSKIIDLGTRFGITAKKGEPAEVHVFEGRVLTQREKTAQRKIPAHPILHSGQAVRETDSSPNGYSLVKTSPDRFNKLLPSGLDHVHLSFDDASLQTTGLAAHGGVEIIRLNGGDIELVEGVRSNAIHFDGSGTHLKVTGFDGIHGSQPRTICFWLRLPETKNPAQLNGVAMVGWASGESDTQGWYIALHGESVVGPPGVIRTGTGFMQGNFGSTYLADGNWHHVAVVYNPTKENTLDQSVTLHINGKRERSSKSTGKTVDTARSSEFEIGRIFRFKGRDVASGQPVTIDELHIFRKALSEQEISDLASIPKP